MDGILNLLGALAPWLADALVILGLLVMTLGVYGIFTLPDVYNRLHASSKVVFLGVVLMLVASVSTGDLAVTYRSILIGVFLFLTTPVAAHAIGRAAFLRGERMEAAGAVDESGRGLNRDRERE